MTGFFLSLFLLLLAFLLKIFIHKKPKGVAYLKAITELPVDIMFISITFIISYRIAHLGKLIREEAVITKELDMNSDFLYFVVYLLLTIPVIVLWRTSKEAINKNEWNKVKLLVLSAYCISFGALIFALIKLNGVV